MKGFLIIYPRKDFNITLINNDLLDLFVNMFIIERVHSKELINSILIPNNEIKTVYLNDEDFDKIKSLTTSTSDQSVLIGELYYALKENESITDRDVRIEELNNKLKKKR